ncbi:MAG: CPBP family intramembrane glutamic endopeptidase [Candidatus Micrarchaeota archaeon]
MATEDELARIFGLPLFFLIFPFLLMKFRGFKFQKMLGYVRLNREDFIPPKKFISTLARAFVLFLLMVFMTILLSIALYFLGFLDSQKVQEIIRQQPQIFIIAAVFVAPVAEEIFFRGFVQRKLGLPVTALLFGSFHFIYGSVTELLGAILLGGILGYYVQKYRSIATPIFAHMFYNAFSVYLALYGL